MENKEPGQTEGTHGILNEKVNRLSDLLDSGIKRIDEKFKDFDTKYQIQFTAAEKAIGIASAAQEKLTAQALDAAKEATNKSEISMDKRFDLFSKKIDELMETINKNAGSQGIYVTHDYLNNSFDKFRNDIESLLKPIVAKLADVTVFVNNQQGKSQGLNSGWIYVLGFFSLVGMILGVISFFNQ